MERDIYITTSMIVVVVVITIINTKPTITFRQIVVTNATSSKHCPRQTLMTSPRSFHERVTSGTPHVDPSDEIHIYHSSTDSSIRRGRQGGVSEELCYEVNGAVGGPSFVFAANLTRRCCCCCFSFLFFFFFFFCCFLSVASYLAC